MHAGSCSKFTAMLEGSATGQNIAYKILNIEIYKDLQRFIRDLQNHKDLQICEDL